MVANIDGVLTTFRDSWSHYMGVSFSLTGASESEGCYAPGLTEEETGSERQVTHPTSHSQEGWERWSPCTLLPPQSLTGSGF